MTPGGALDPLQFIILHIVGALWVYRAHWDMLNSNVLDSHFGKRPVAGEITTFVSYVGAQGLNS